MEGTTTLANGMVLPDKIIDRSMRRRIERFGVYERVVEKIFDAAMERIPREGTFANFGSAFGYYVVLALLKRPDLKVVAAEPQEEYYGLMWEILELNGLSADNVLLYTHPVTADGRSVGMEHWGYGLSVGGPGDVPTVPVGTIVENEGVPDFLLTDIQGAEAEIFGPEAGDEILVRYVPEIVACTHHGAHEKCLADLFRFGRRILRANEPRTKRDGIVHSVAW